MTGVILTETAAELGKDWEIELPDEAISEEVLLRLLADRIVVILERGPEFFFQAMYRLDISEKKLNLVLGDDDVPAKIARLVYDRQLQKIISRHENRMKREDMDSELQW